LAAELDELGTIYVAQARFADAEPLVRRSLEIREKALARDSSETAKSFMLLGAIASGPGRLTPPILRSLRTRPRGRPSCSLAREAPDAEIQL
jgi:hypothetical protein